MRRAGAGPALSLLSCRRPAVNSIAACGAQQLGEPVALLVAQRRRLSENLFDVVADFRGDHRPTGVSRASTSARRNRTMRGPTLEARGQVLDCAFAKMSLRVTDRNLRSRIRSTKRP